MVQAPVAVVVDRKGLETMSRQQLQQLAKREGVKASAKSIQIIEQLLEKYPGGVPRPVQPVLTIKKPKLPRFEATLFNGSSSLWDSSSEESCTFESRLFRMNMEAMQHSMESRARAADWAEGVAISGKLDEPAVRPFSPPAGLGPKDVREVRRDLTRLVNDLPSIQQDISDTHALVETAAERLRTNIDTLRELVSTRNALESTVAQRMKDGQWLWDGTYYLKTEKDRQAWLGFLADAKEAAQREEEEEKARDELRQAEIKRQNDMLAFIENERADRRVKKRQRRHEAQAKLGLRKRPPPIEEESQPVARATKRKRKN